MFYRYRPIHAVLDGFSELENQEIYFSETGELNDPMEGYKDLFWLGDLVVWKNLVRHYMLCLLQAFVYCFVPGEAFDPNCIRQLIFATPISLPEAPIREIYYRLSAELLAEPVAVTFLSMLVGRTTPVRRNELTSYLRALHAFALRIVMREWRDKGLLAQSQVAGVETEVETLRRHAIGMLEGAAKITPSEQFTVEAVSEELFAANEAAAAQLNLISEYNFPERDKYVAVQFLMTHLPTAYVSALEKLVHRDWYVACFARSAEDHSMWSMYADGHRGVCLCFKSIQGPDGNPRLPLKRVTGVSVVKDHAPIYLNTEVPHELDPVQYGRQYPRVDFFRSLGAVSNQHLSEFWYRDDDGSISACREAISSDEEGWRRAYWRTFSESALCKTAEWAHEKEWRIVVHSMLFDLSQKENRKLKFRFQNLEGIVFGARTGHEDRLKVIRLIEAKCRKEDRTNFKFSEIRYLPSQSRFAVFSLDLLKFQGLNPDNQKGPEPSKSQTSK